MDQATIIAGIEARARRAGLSITAFCAAGGIVPITWRRWRAGYSRANQETLARIETFVARAERAQAAARAVMEGEAA